jgi:hypothetical protein
LVAIPATPACRKQRKRQRETAQSEKFNLPHFFPISN